MKRWIVLLMAIVVAGFPLAAPAADGAATKADVEAFVREAVAYAKAEGKDKALAEFMNPDGRFFQGELYIFAYDYEGTVISHGAKPKLVGKNLMRLKDAKGTDVIQELSNLASQGEGWLRYYWEHPGQKKVLPKLGYVMNVDGSWWLGSGMYEDQ